MRNDHHGKNNKLVKRAFALCLALAVICSCLLPVFATEGGWIATQELNASTQVATMDTAASTSQSGAVAAQPGISTGGGIATGGISRPVTGGVVTDPVVDSGSTSDSTSSGSTSASTSASTSTSESTASSTTGTSEVITDPSTITDVKIPDGATNIVKNANGSYSYTTEYGRITVFPTKEGEKTTWKDDEVTITPNPNLKEDDAAFGVLPIEYHFWLKQLDSDTFRELDWEAQMAEMSETEYLALFGASEKFPIWHMDTIASTDTISNYKFANPTSKDDPAGEGREFAYWYTVDENGVESEFNPYKTYGSESDTIVNVYAAWKEADGTESKDESASTTTTKKTVTATTSDGVTITVKGLPETAKSLSVEPMSDSEMDSFYKLYSAQKNGTAAPIVGFNIEPFDATGNVVQPKGPVTVTISGLGSELATYPAPYKMLHQVTASDVQTINASYDENNDVLTFATNSFSPFVVASKDGFKTNTQAINSLTNVSIKDDIANSGHFILKITADGKDYEGAEAGKLLKESGYTVTWQKGDTVVSRYEVTNGVYSLEENGGWVNVVYTDGANANYTVSVSNGSTTNRASQKVNYNDELQNYSFEDVTSTGTSALDDNRDGRSPTMAWKTTASDHKIEVGNTTAWNGSQEWQYENNRWTQKSLYQTEYSYGCSSAVSGKQFAELNANGVGALYQDVLTMPGQTMNWQFYHKARTRISSGNQNENVVTSGSDTMAMVIAPVELVENVTTHDQLQTLLGKCSNKNGSNIVTGDGTMGVNGKEYTVYVYESTSTIKDKSETRWDGQHRQYLRYSTSDWKKNSGTYTVPTGQYLTRFFFAAIDTATSSTYGHSVGNLLDDVWFSQNVVPPTSGSGQVTVTKKMYGLTMDEAKSLVKQGFISYKIDQGASVTIEFTEGDAWSSGVDEQGSYISVSHTIFNANVSANTRYVYTVTENVNKANVADYTLIKTLVDNVEAISGNVTLSKEHNNESITFSNFYEKNTSSIIISKTVTGLMGDTNKSFSFTIKNDKGEVPAITKDNIAVNDSEKAEWNESTGEFTLKHGGMITISNLPQGIYYIEEETTENYKARITVVDGVVADEDNSAKATVTLGAEAKTVAYTNECDLKPDLGILLDTLPYIVILAVVAGGGVLLMLRKRRKSDD